MMARSKKVQAALDEALGARLGEGQGGLGREMVAVDRGRAI